MYRARGRADGKENESPRQELMEMAGTSDGSGLGCGPGGGESGFYLEKWFDF